MFAFHSQRKQGCNNRTWSVAQTHEQQKREDSFLDESSLSFCLLSDMLTKVSVIFLLCKSDIKPYGFRGILFARKLAKQITLG